jgi:predicted nicotinamide N-methyase
VSQDAFIITTAYTNLYLLLLQLFRWRAAEHLCQFIIDNPDRFQGKSVCELGAGLGLVSILLDKLNVCSSLVSTDGCEDTVRLLIENKIDTGKLVKVL